MDILQLNTYGFAALCFHCIFVAVFLFTSREQRGEHALLLGCTFVMLGTWYATIFMKETGVFEAYPWVIGWPTAFTPLLVSSPYLYTVALSSRKPWHLREQSPWHLIFALAIILLDLPFLLADSETKILQLDHMLHEPDNLNAILLNMAWLANALILAQFAIYIFLSIRRLLDHAERIQHLFSNLENRTLAWLRNYLIFLCLLWFMGLSDFMNLPDSYNWIIHIFWVFGFSLFSIRQRPVFELPADRETEQEEETETPPADKTNKSNLPDEKRHRVAEKLRRAMEQDRLYQDADLTLRKLSDAVGVSTHHISETLRDEIGQNFYDYVNGCRISEACERLTDTDDATIDIAFAVGFNSRSTFSAAFKKHRNTSPAAYRKNAA